MAKKKAIETGRDDYLDEDDAISVLEHWMDIQRSRLYTAMPGQVVEFNRDRQEAVVLPAVNDRFGDGDTKPHPPIAHVPVVFPHGAGMSITFDVQPGDFGLIVWSKQSIDEWAARGGTNVQPTSRRYHSLNDAMFIPGIRWFAAPLRSVEEGALLVGDDHYADPDSTEPLKRLRITATAAELVRDKEGEPRTGFRVTTGRKVAIGELEGADPAELVSIVHDAISAIKGATVATALGPQPLDPATITTLTTLLTKLATLKV